MKTLLTLITLVGLTFTSVFASDQHAADQTCPADRAAEAGHNPFGAFHEIMAPTWHGAWPDSNFAALFAAGPAFAEAFKPIAAMNPTFKSDTRKATFETKRTAFAEAVAAYADAAAEGDTTKVYALMPGLHEAFEMAASALLPVHYPEFEGMVITLNLILETHLPNNNTEGIVGSTETLLAKLNALTPETLPVELQEETDAVIADLAFMHEIVVKMNACCTNNDMATYTDLAKSLDTQVKLFIEKYI